jgi:hypothetical protein
VVLFFSGRGPAAGPDCCDAAFAWVAAGLALIAVLDHELEAVDVAGFESELADVPAGFGAEALV